MSANGVSARLHPREQVAGIEQSIVRQNSNDLLGRVDSRDVQGRISSFGGVGGWAAYDSQSIWRVCHEGEIARALLSIPHTATRTRA